jgi:hypothetical protein
MSSPIRPPRPTARVLARAGAPAAAVALAAAVTLAALALVALAPLGRAGAMPASVRVSAGPREYGCPILPARDALNTPITNAPVDPSSAAYVASIGLEAHLHPDFGQDPSYGIPYDVVPPTQPRVAVRFTGYPAESDPGPYPIPANAPVEGAGAEGDRHVVIVQRGTCKLYELYAAERSGGGWRASNGAVFDLRASALRPAGWTSADAAGLPIFPLLVRYPEVASGRIDHALRVTVPRTQHAYIHPATHFASSSADPSLPPMGLRLRLKADYSLAGFSGQALVILRALKRYGLIVADNGSPWYITGAPNTRWDEASLAQLKRVPGSAFEAVRTGAIIRR